MEKKLAHLGMMQGVINRLSHNSFLLKGWSIVLVSAMFALSAKDANPIFIYLAYFPAIMFWGLDAYFLWQERLFRSLYGQISGFDEENIDFSMNTKPVEKKTKGIISSFFSLTILGFHGVIVISIILVMIFL